MKILGCMTVLTLSWLADVSQVMATTAVRSRNTLARVDTQQIIPRDTLRAGQDIELRKVQALLSRQGPPPGKKSKPRR
jgi:hypothetical protein